MFAARRQFASAIGAEEIDAEIQLPSGAEIADDGTAVYPATVWADGNLLKLEKYFAAVDGTVWSGRRGSLKKISATEKQRVSLYAGGMQRNFYAHRIVASTFLSAIRHAGQDEVDHVDINTKNNALENLRWATRAQNAANKCPVRAEGNAKRARELFSQKVQQLCLETGDVIAEFESGAAAAEATGAKGISNVIAKRRKTSGGFAWRSGK